PLEQVFVEDYWPVDQGDAVSVEIVDHRIFTEIFHKKDSEHFIIGWAHSHPSYTPFLSGDDYQTHLRYQTFWNKSIALVIDPLMKNPSNMIKMKVVCISIGMLRRLFTFLLIAIAGHNPE
ncbi:unnamed protein product, partial [marine sediment metagenome]